MAVSDKPRKKRSVDGARIVKIGAPQEINQEDFWYPVDWNKVKNINDIKIILANMGLGCKANAPNYNDLKKYLSDVPQIQQ